jgi:hypothetical protein
VEASPDAPVPMQDEGADTVSRIGADGVDVILGPARDR